MSEAPEPTPRPVQTGVASVDAALEDIAALEDRPLAEHPAAFEQVHERLRGALQDDPRPPSGQQSGQQSGQPSGRPSGQH